LDKTWEENIAESVANELVLQLHAPNASYSKSGSLPGGEQQDDSSKGKSKDSKQIKPGRASHEEKKVGKSNDDKRSRPRKMMEFHNIRISQVSFHPLFFGGGVDGDLCAVICTIHCFISFIDSSLFYYAGRTPGHL